MIRNLFIFCYIIINFASISFHNHAYSQESVTDFDGNIYKTVKIGDQQWMAENLRSIHDARGNKIRRVCYRLNTENCEIFGGMYAWEDLKVSADSLQGICPDGWHIPDDEEWAEMFESIGGLDSAAYKINHDSISGFNIQYGGNYHRRLRNYNYLDEIAYYWTADEFSPTAAWMRMIGRRNINANRSTIPKVYCISVRCVKD